MRTTALLLAGLFAGLACSKPGPASGAGDAGGASATSLAASYSAANGDPLSFEFKPGGVVAMDGGPLGSATGTYSVDGEKLLVTMNGRTYTFIKDGSCISDVLSVFGKLCIGGQAGAEANVSTRGAPPTTGTWVAASTDGEFKLEFKAGNKLTLTLTTPGGQPNSKEGSFVVDGDVVQATLDQSEPLTLKFVNDGYETTSFGLAMRFVRQPGS